MHWTELATSNRCQNERGGETELRPIVSNDFTVVSLRRGDNKVPTPYDCHQSSVALSDFLLADPSINVSNIDKELLARDTRYSFGIPRADNGNHLWNQNFHSALNKKGRAGFVMANSAADARASEQEIREKIIRAGHVDVMVALG